METDGERQTEEAAARAAEGCPERKRGHSNEQDKEKSMVTMVTRDLQLNLIEECEFSMSPDQNSVRN